MAMDVNEWQFMDVNVQHVELTRIVPRGGA